MQKRFFDAPIEAHASLKAPTPFAMRFVAMTSETIAAELKTTTCLAARRGLRTESPHYEHVHHMLLTGTVRCQSWLLNRQLGRA